MRNEQMRVLFPVGNLPAMNVPIRFWDGVVVFESMGARLRIDDDHPSYEGSHLLGFEGSYGCYCYYRLASAEEVAAMEAKEAEARATAEAGRARERAIEAIKAQILERGERPAGWHDVDGERLIDTQNIYGGGSWFVVTATHIWYVRNNGADGDDWAANNVRTGGAGAIGHRIAYDAELAEELRELHRGRC